MKLVLLGTTGYHPSETRQTACVALPELGVVFDAGTGFFRYRKHLCTPTLDIYLSHAHLDHVVGLTFLFDVLFGHTTERVTVHGREADLQAIQTHLLAPSLFPVALPCQFEPLPAVAPLPGGGKLTSFPLTHPGGSLGFRADWPGHSLAYVTDTTAKADSSYAELIRGVDLLIHECNFSDDLAAWAEKTGHSHTTPVAQLAARAQVGRLLLVHVNPLIEGDDPIGLSVAQAIFPATEIAYDGQVVEF